MSKQIKQIVAFSFDYDGCTDILNDFIPNPLPTRNDLFPRVRPFTVLHRRQLSRHDRLKCAQLWNVIARALGGHRIPDVVMSGSARILYQNPLVREQDGIAHTVVLNNTLLNRGYPPVELRALHQKDGGSLSYSTRGTPRVKAETRGKIAIVRDQAKLVRALHPTAARIQFVFVDDIYATKIAEVLRANPEYRIVPNDVTLHLIHYESSDPLVAVDMNAASQKIRQNVFYWPMR